MTQAQQSTPEVRRKKVFVPPGLTASEIAKKYGINPSTAGNAKKRIFRKELCPETDHD